MAEQQKLEADGKKVEKRLVIDLQDQYNAVIEDASATSNSIYCDQYRQAEKCTSEILSHGKQLKDSSKNICTKYKEQDFNNIIAFCGERGTGKTSTMLSYARLLENISNESNKEYNKPKSIYDYSYQLIDVVDPSLFEKNENLFEVVLAKMFSKTMDKLKMRHENRHLEKEGKRKLLECYSSVYRDLGAIHQKDENRYKGDALETLSELSSGSNLKANFKKLVDCFLEYHASNNRSCNKDEVLVIPIDDFDLNTESASEMGEQIRKYLMIPNVVILMAVNMEQLTNVKEQSVRNKFKTLIDAGRLYEDPKEFAVNYLVKLIPHNRRIQLNTDPNFVKETIIDVKDGETVLYKSESGGSIEKYILSTINKLTGLIFLPKENKEHFLVPTTLRRLRGMLYFLNSLDDTECQKKKSNKFDDSDCKECKSDKSDDPDSQNSKLDNLEKFLEYIVNHYIPEILSLQECNIIHNFISSNASCKNKQLVLDIRNYILEISGKKEKIDGDICRFLTEKILYLSENNGVSNKDELELIFNQDNFSENISLRDVLLVVNSMENCFYINRPSKLISAIKVIYSIELYRLMNKDTNGARIMMGESIVPFTFYIPRKKVTKAKLPRNDFYIDYKLFAGIESKELKDQIMPFLTFYSQELISSSKGSSFTSRPKKRRIIGINHSLRDVNKLVSKDTRFLFFDFWTFIISKIFVKENEEEICLSPQNKWSVFHSIELIESAFQTDIRSSILGKNHFGEISSIVDKIVKTINTKLSLFEMNRICDLELEEKLLSEDTINENLKEGYFKYLYPLSDNDFPYRESIEKLVAKLGNDNRYHGGINIKTLLEDFDNNDLKQIILDLIPKHLSNDPSTLSRIRKSSSLLKELEEIKFMSSISEIKDQLELG